AAVREEVLRQACAQVGVAVFGPIPRHPELAVPSRHLGLVTAAERGALAVDAVDAMTGLVAAHVDLAGVESVAAGTVTDAPWDPAEGLDDTAIGRVTVAMAAGKASTFGYAEHVEMLQAAGAEGVGFDPLTDTLPPGTDALVLPGGFPEQFTAELAANNPARQQVRTLAAGGAAVHAECGGRAYLVAEPDGYPMCGVLAGSGRFTDHLTLGYRHAVAV